MLRILFLPGFIHCAMEAILINFFHFTLMQPAEFSDCYFIGFFCVLENFICEIG